MKIVATDGVGNVLVMDPSTGAMAPASDRISSAPVDEQTYRVLLDSLRQPILERIATMALPWEATGDNDEPYRVEVDGHELTIHIGYFPDEPLYLLRIDGQELYALDDWPSAWSKPGAAG